MVKAVQGIAIGVLIFILTLTLTEIVLTGTDFASTVMQTFLPLAVGFGVLIYVIASLFRVGKGV